MPFRLLNVLSLPPVNLIKLFYSEDTDFCVLRKRLINHMKRFQYVQNTVCYCGIHCLFYASTLTIYVSVLKLNILSLKSQYCILTCDFSEQAKASMSDSHVSLKPLQRTDSPDADVLVSTKAAQKGK